MKNLFLVLAALFVFSHSQAGVVTRVSAGKATLAYKLYSNSVSNTGTVTVAPLISVTGTVNAFIYCPGTATAAQSFSVSGTNLTDNISIAAPTGFEVSTSSASGYGSSISLTQSGGTVTATTVYVRVSSTATGTPSGNVAITSSGATTENVAVNAGTNNALYFDGSNDIVSLSSNSIVDGATQFTIEAWIKPDNLNFNGSWHAIFGRQPGGLNSRVPSIYIKSDSNMMNAKIHLSVFEDNTLTDYGFVTPNAYIIPNVWSHLAVVKEGLKFKIYVNGIFVYEAAAPNAVNVPNTYQMGYVDNYYAGLIDDVRFWNTSRSALEISTKMNETLAGTETGLVDYYTFNQGTQNASNAGLTTLYDTTASANNGTLYNFALTGTTSNYVPGYFAQITGTSTIPLGTSSQLSHVISGGSWTSSDTNIVTVSNLGLVTSVAVGSAVVSYTSCGQTTTVTITVAAPLISVTGTVNAFTYWPGTASTAQSFSVSGTNLADNISIAAPAGFEVSKSSASGYASSISLTQSGGTVNATTVYIRVSSTATGAPSGNVAISSLNATTQNVAVNAGTNNALSFDGTNDYVDLGIPTATKLTNNFSISAWVKTGVTAKRTFLSNQWLHPTSGLLIGLNSQGKFHIAISDGTTPALRDTNAFISDNNWHHLTVTFSSGTLNSYVDGVLIDSFATGLSALSYNGSTHFMIGKDSGTGVEYWNGLVDEVTMWDKVLTQTEVATYMNNSPAGSETNLVGYWDFNNGIAGGTNTGVTTLYNRTSNLINGTLTNFDLTGTTSNWVNGYMPTITTPTSISGTTSICNGSSTTLTSSGGNLSSEGVNVWYEGSCGALAFHEGFNTQPTATYDTTINSNSNGILNVTTSNTYADPQISMFNLGSFDPGVYKYINFRYRVVSGTAGLAQLFFLNSTDTYATDLKYLDQTLVSDGQWHTVSVNMSTHSLWAANAITGIRYDYATLSGVTLDLDFIELSTAPILETGSSITVSPTATTTYYVNRKGYNVNTTCVSQEVTVNALPVPSFTAQPNDIFLNTNTSYTAVSGQSNYSWTIPGTLNTDYTITSGGTTTDNTLVLKWLTKGSKTVGINYANANNCSATTATSSNSITARNYGINVNGSKISNPALSLDRNGKIGSGKSVSKYGEIMNVSLPDGSTAAKAGSSALQIKTAYPASTDGVYWIDLPNAGPTQIYCLMDSNYDGGGWMLAMKATTGTTFNYAANYWTTANTLNTTDNTRNDGDAKYETMNNFEAKDMMAIWPDISNISTESGSIDNLSNWSWLQNNFHSGNRTTLISKFGGSQVTYYTALNGSMTFSGYNTSKFSKQEGFSFYGINYLGNGVTNAKVRWGFIWNNEADQGSNDVSGGIGMSFGNYSAGDYISCCENSIGINRSARVEVYIR